MLNKRKFTEVDKTQQIKIVKRNDGRKNESGKNTTRYYARIQIGYKYDKTGQKKYKYKDFYGYSPESVRLSYCDWITEQIKIQEGEAETQELFYVQFEEWLRDTKYNQGDLKTNSFDRFEQTYFQQIKPYLNEIPHRLTKDIDSNDILKLLGIVRDKGYSHSTYKKVYYCLTNFFNEMVEDGRLKVSPVKKKHLIKESEYRKAYQTKLFEKREAVRKEIFGSKNVTQNELKMLADVLKAEITDEVLALHPSKVKRDELTFREIDYYKNQAKKNHTLDDQSVNYLNKIFKFSFDADDYYLLFSPLSLRDKTKDDMIIFSEEEIAKIIDVLENGYYLNFISRSGNPYKTGPHFLKEPEIFRLMLNTGLRVSEMAGLRFSDIDFENRTLTVSNNIKYIKNRDKSHNAVQGSTYVEGTPKSEESQKPIKLNDTAFGILAQRKAKEDKDYKGYVFYSEDKDGDRKPLTVHILFRRFQNLLSRAGVRQAGTHSLRHTFASMLFDISDNNIAYVSDKLRHAQVSTTANTYVHISAKKKEELDKALEI